MSKRTVPDEVFSVIARMEIDFFDLLGAVTALSDLPDDAEYDGWHWLACNAYRATNDLRKAYYRLHAMATGNDPDEEVRTAGLVP